jgi:Holliday junction resolvase RusA-like endonuclease
MIEFRVAIEPVAFSRPRFSRSRKTGKVRGFNAPAYAAFKEEFQTLARRHRPTAPLTGPLVVEFTFGLVPPLKAKPHKTPAPCVRPDLDNYVKAVNDSLDGFFVDDGQVVGIRAEKVYAWDRKPFIRVYIAEAVPPEQGRWEVIERE